MILETGKPLSLDFYLRKALPEELNIFNHIYLVSDTPLLKSNKIVEKTKYENAIKFILQGDLQGHCLCFIDTYEHKLESTQLNELQSIFKESANILLGNTLSALEKNYLVSISHPMEQGRLSSYKIEDSFDSYSTSYKLIYNLKEYYVRLVFQIREKR